MVKTYKMNIAQKHMHLIVMYQMSSQLVVDFSPCYSSCPLKHNVDLEVAELTRGRDGHTR